MRLSKFFRVAASLAFAPFLCIAFAQTTTVTPGPKVYGTTNTSSCVYTSAAYQFSLATNGPHQEIELAAYRPAENPGSKAQSAFSGYCPQGGTGTGLGGRTFVHGASENAMYACLTKPESQITLADLAPGDPLCLQDQPGYVNLSNSIYNQSPTWFFNLGGLCNLNAYTPPVCVNGFSGRQTGGVFKCFVPGSAANTTGVCPAGSSWSTADKNGFTIGYTNTQPTYGGCFKN